jgi:hypothetical protein
MISAAFMMALPLSDLSLSAAVRGALISIKRNLNSASVPIVPSRTGRPHSRQEEEVAKAAEARLALPAAREGEVLEGLPDRVAERVDRLRAAISPHTVEIRSSRPGHLFPES